MAMGYRAIMSRPGASSNPALKTESRQHRPINAAYRLAMQSLFHFPRIILADNLPHVKAYTQPLQEFSGQLGQAWTQPSGQRSPGRIQKQPSLQRPQPTVSSPVGMPWDT